MSTKSRILYLLRHAKSDWSQVGQNDFDRGLNSRGKSDAPMMGKILKDRMIELDHIYSSPAKRAKLTTKMVTEQLEIKDEKISFEEEIYEASPRTLLQLINNLPSDQERVMMVGHNPTFTYLAEYLTKEEIGNMPTSGIVKIRFELEDWELVSEGTGILEWFDYPKKHKPA